VVYMGMGEPFLNWDNVSESIRLLNQEDLFNIGSRSISVSTAGIPDKIIKFADTFPQVNLALSLHSAIQRKREEIMPIAKQYDLEELKKALNYYLSKTKRKIFIEYIMLDQFNDADNDLNELIKFFGEIKERYLLHLNLIPFNVTTSKHKPSSQKTMKHFQEMLIRNKIELTVRKSLGLDIDGACGQLGKK
ncbi:MAG: 23S rRNA (adenine(2503)-C(2))-methyltransferase RlmN, partial [Candidatus Falkowbacteria bacterium]|nr:23S rRNA (adenine(2503)-C(2))-methyltransferase RlmN [Candidatus Falkowbacteria bacterium]